MADATELDDLDALVTSPGWQRFSQHLVGEWGPAGQRYQQAVKMAAAKEGDHAVHHLRAVIFAQEEIAKLLTWPTARLGDLRGQARAVGGVGQSRRGLGL